MLMLSVRLTLGLIAWNCGAECNLRTLIGKVQSFNGRERDGGQICSSTLKNSFMKLVNEPNHKSGSLLDLVMVQNSKKLSVKKQQKNFFDYCCISVTTCIAC